MCIRDRSSKAILAKRSKAASEITAVAKLIADIAEQTNLLALNATIEAARVAGSIGKLSDAAQAIAVVDEVARNAEQTSASAKETGAAASLVASEADLGKAVAAFKAEA